MSLSLEKKILYSNVFCKYRETLPYKLACKHPWGFGICDLDLCPIAQPFFANVIFQPEGIVLIVKKPSDSKVAGEVKKVPLKITPDNEHEIIELVKKEAEGINEKNMKALLERIRRIYERYRFLRSRGIEVPILEEVAEHEEA